MIVDVLADLGRVVASIVQEVIGCFSLGSASMDIMFILVAVGASVLADGYVLNWCLLQFFCRWWRYLRVGSNCGGLKRFDRLAFGLSVGCKQVVLCNMALQDLKDVCCLLCC